MYDTEKRIELVKKRMHEYHRRQERRTVCRLSVLCTLLFLSLVGTMGMMQSQPIDITGMYGTILLHEDAGGYVLVAVISFTVAVVITALCIKFRKKGTKESGCRRSCIKKGKGEKYEEKIISRDSGTCTVFCKYASPDYICGGIYFRKSGCSV